MSERASCLELLLLFRDWLSWVSFSTAADCAEPRDLLLELELSEEEGPPEELVEKKVAGVVVLIGMRRAWVVEEGTARPRAVRRACRGIFGVVIILAQSVVIWSDGRRAARCRGLLTSSTGRDCGRSVSRALWIARVKMDADRAENGGACVIGQLARMWGWTLEAKVSAG
jgi:hypothetical protein